MFPTLEQYMAHCAVEAAKQQQRYKQWGKQKGIFLTQRFRFWEWQWQEEARVIKIATQLEDYLTQKDRHQRFLERMDY